MPQFLSEPRSDSPSEAQKEHILKKVWPLTTERYTARHLSLHSDTLHAIRAPAKVIAEATQAVYMAGFWKPLTVSGLAWGSIGRNGTE